MDYTFAGMNGVKVNKKIKRPEDLFKLPTDTPVKPGKTLSGNAANDFMKTIVKQ